MAGSATITEQTFNTVKKIRFDWISGDDGTVVAATVGQYSGEVLRAVFIPDEGDTQPDDDYDVAVNDSDGLDVLNNLGANCDNAAAEQVIGNMGAVANSKLSLAVSGAGAANKGIVVLYIR